MKETTLEKISFKAGCNNSIHYREIFNISNNKGEYKVRILMDTDDSNPKDATIEVLNGLEWKILYSIPFNMLKVRKGLANYPEYASRSNNGSTATKEFQEDVKILKDMLIKLLLS